MLKVKGKCLRSWAVDNIPRDIRDNILAEVELPKVNPEDLKEGQTVLVKAQMKMGANGGMYIKYAPFDSGRLIGSMNFDHVVAILPEEKKEQVDSESLNDLSELKIAIWENPLTQGFILQGNEKTRWEKHNQLCDIVERLVKERKCQ